MSASIIRTVSPQGLAFNARHEGKVLRAYRCPAGRITIGFGFTMSSKIFAQWWRAKHGRALRLGDSMSESDALMLLEKLMNEEYGHAVAERIKPRKQHHFDAASSMTYNCGTGATKWRWARALARGEVAKAADLLRVTATTAGGRPLAGLKRRRADEAMLLETGDYGVSGTSPALSTFADHAADLAALGYGLDNWRSEVIAIRAFQRDHDLTVDGLIGPATRAALIRAAQTKRQNRVAAGGGVVGAGAAGGAEVMADPQAIEQMGVETASWVLAAGVGVALLVFAGFMIWRYRGPLFVWLPEPVKDFAERFGVTLGRRVRT